MMPDFSKACTAFIFKDQGDLEALNPEDESGTYLQNFGSQP